MVYSAFRPAYCRTGLLATFALWWYMELLPENELCENSNAFFRAVPRDFRTGDHTILGLASSWDESMPIANLRCTGDPTLDGDIVTCEGYMAYGTDLFGQIYNQTLCGSNFTLIEHKYDGLPPIFSNMSSLRSPTLIV